VVNDHESGTEPWGGVNKLIHFLIGLGTIRFTRTSLFVVHASNVLFPVVSDVGGRERIVNVDSIL
jgi:hypothetical protein